MILIRLLEVVLKSEMGALVGVSGGAAINTDNVFEVTDRSAILIATTLNLTVLPTGEEGRSVITNVFNDGLLLMLDA